MSVSYPVRPQRRNRSLERRTSAINFSKNAVQARVVSQKAPENKGGRPAFYLLSGVLRCGECNGPLTVINGKQSNEMIKMYTCCRRRDRGGTVCPSTLRREVASIDGAVLDWVRDNVLTEEYATEVIAEAHRRIEEQNSTRAGDNEQFERLAKKLRAEIDKFAEMTLEAPDETRAVFFAKVSERQKQLADIEAKMHAVNTRSAAKGVDFHEMEREAREQLQNVAELFEEHPTEMRALVKALFPEGLKVTHSNGPTGNGTRMDGNAAHKGLKILA